ncbi:MAG TPA: DUF1592 domain-containing protein, partial [Pirellulales bacterium]|nr:DUF1592 domain-containing protein [Pirellulales bacterium]
AGDPGRVVLRRLNNAEYTYTLRDLTGVESLEPAREFPVDGAAGEGFTNTGNSLVMSPALFAKYLDAGKQIAAHAVLLPDGIRFSSYTTRADKTHEIVEQIRAFYREFTAAGGRRQVQLQGLVFDADAGGRLPLEDYLAAALAERDALASGAKSIEQVARQHGLSPKYLNLLCETLNSQEPSLLLDRIREPWRSATPPDAAAIAGDITRWQKALWKFGSVGHIGKVGGPKAWQEPVTPLVARQEIRLKLPPAAEGQGVTLFLAAGDAGDGNEHDFVVWEHPRLVAPGRPDLLLRDVRDATRQLAQHRKRVFAAAAKCLAAAEEAKAAGVGGNVAALAERHGVAVDVLQSWLDLLGIGPVSGAKIDSLFATKIDGSAGYAFIQGWSTNDLPALLANSSGEHVRVPGNMKPHGVAVHPTPTVRAVIGWRSPVAATVRVGGKVAHAHPECGNGVTWSLELRRNATRQRLAAGIAHGANAIEFGPLEKLAVEPGDVLSLAIGPRDGNHSCDLTAVDLAIVNEANAERKWDLAGDVSSDVLAGNPHADRLGNAGVWHFYSEPDQPGAGSEFVIPGGSLLAKWQSAPTAEEKLKLAEALQTLLTSPPPAEKESPDAILRRQLASLGGPLFGSLRRRTTDAAAGNADSAPAGDEPQWGLDRKLFGRHPDGREIDAANLCAKAPAVIEIRLPADLGEGCEFVTTATLDGETGRDGCVQTLASIARPELGSAPSPDLPFIALDGSPARQRVEAAFDAFRGLFPAALCYTRIVPVDEVVTLTLYHREDDQLRRLILDEAQAAALDRLWDELHYVSQDALTLVDAYAQLMEYATQDGDPSLFEPLREPIQKRAAAFRQLLVDTESKHVEGLLQFAGLAYRRPLTAAESQELRGLYARLRDQELPHEEALRLTLARVLVSAAFLYRLETPPAGASQAPVSDWELASRLSYFLWSSQPDEELRRLAAAGRLHDPAVLMAQLRRMLGDGRTRRLATEFACHWLHIEDFDQLDEKSEKHFPEFAALRGAMYEESIRFFTDWFQNDGTVLDLLEADYTFLNESLAKHYGIPGIEGEAWRRIDGVKRFSRGGILAQATTLAKQSGASRTSPILRGNWVSEVLLGERLPRPPKDVPQLPDAEAGADGLSVRQRVEQHSSNPKCAICHERIDPFGFALENFDAIGRFRQKDLGDRPIDTRVKSLDGAEFEGIDGLRNYLLTVRRETFVRQFCRKLLGYALGRAVQLSDEPLFDEIYADLKANDYHILVAVEKIVGSRPFREIRGRDTAYEE